VRTRRSPRNQDRLWRALGREGAAPPVVPVEPTPRCWDCASYPKGGRGRGKCSLVGEVVNGRTADRPCFRGATAEAPGAVCTDARHEVPCRLPCEACEIECNEAAEVEPARAPAELAADEAEQHEWIERETRR